MSVKGNYDDLFDSDALNKIKTTGHSELYLDCEGFGNVDLDYAKSLGIKVFHLESHSANSVADNALRLYFKWCDNFGKRFELRGKSVVVIGSQGYIGSEVCKRFEGCGCNVFPFDIKNKFGIEKFLLSWLERADIIVLCIPEKWGQKSVLTAKHFERMWQEPLIINCSGRTSLVSFDVLKHYIYAIKGYACDELFNNELTKTYPKKFFCEKHCGANTVESQERKKKLIESNKYKLVT